MKKRKLLITGAAGFVGRNFLIRYRKKLSKFNILLLVYKKSDKKEKKFEQLFEKWGFKTVKVDLIDKKSLAKLNFDPDIVIHLAASTDTSKKDHRANDLGSKNLVESLKSLNSKTHFLYTSTTAVYAGRKNLNKPINENTISAPSNEYGRTKLKAEKYLKEIYVKKKFRLTILKFTTVYGKNTRENGLFSILKKDIKKGGIISKLNWPGLTSLVHVDDVSDVLWKMINLSASSSDPESYIVLSESFTLQQISKIMHKKMDFNYIEFKLPNIFWKIVKNTSKLNASMEKILPYSLYNLFWRLSLISDHALWCESSKLKNKLKNWKPRKFNDGAADVVS